MSFLLVVTAPPGRATVRSRWRGLSWLHVNVVRRRGAFRPHNAVVLSMWPFGAARQLHFVGAAFCGHASISLVVAAFTGPHDRFDSLAQPFAAAR